MVQSICPDCLSGLETRLPHFCPYFQMEQWSCRVLSTLWWREMMSLSPVQQRPPTSQQISIKMAPSSGLSLQVTWSSTVFPGLMKDSTSVTPSVMESPHPSGSLSQVRRFPLISHLISSTCSPDQVRFSLQVNKQPQHSPPQQPRPNLQHHPLQQSCSLAPPPFIQCSDCSTTWWCSVHTASPLSSWCLYIDTMPH